jgi:DNA-binding GntR family transcriptional regulator
VIAEDRKPGAPAMTQMSAPLTKADMAYRQVREEIVEGALAPGTPIDQEALAARLGLSTTPVREALRRLESEGLVVSRPHRDTIVAPLTLQQLEDTYSVRLALDPLAIANATKRASDDELQAIAELCRQAISDTDPVSQMYQNRNLHRAMYRACGNAVLIQILDALWDSSDRFRLTTLQDDRTVHRAHVEHSAIVEAMVQRRGEDAAELMRQHVADSLERIREAPWLNA